MSLQNSVPKYTATSKVNRKAKVGRTPWSAVDPLVDPFRIRPAFRSSGAPTPWRIGFMLLFALNANAAVDGVVVNQTTGKPQAIYWINL